MPNDSATEFVASIIHYHQDLKELDVVIWLDELIDAHAKALSEEGLLGDEDALFDWDPCDTSHD